MRYPLVKKPLTRLFQAFEWSPGSFIWPLSTGLVHSALAKTLARKSTLERKTMLRKVIGSLSQFQGE